VYAVVRIAGKQFMAKPNEIVDVPLLDIEPGSIVSCDEVLAYSDGKEVRVGRPRLEGIKVTGEVIGHGRDDKVLLFKHRKRKNYRRKKGHVQRYTRLRITSISA
jgi:large subunit ribosomal protein L21